MTDHDPTNQPDDRAQRALRDTLRSHADGPIFRPLHLDVSAAPSPRRWTRWVPAAAVVALVALAVPLVLSQTGGGPSGAVPQQASGETAPAASSQADAPTMAASGGWRWESYKVLSYQVPTTWGYGYAPDMTEGAGEVYVLYDPEQSLDAMHAALFKRPFTTLLPCRHLGADIAGDLLSMHILPSVLSAAATGTFDAGLFWTFFRARRNHLPYLKRMLRRLEADGRPGLGAMLARNAGQRHNDAQFLARAEELSRQIEDALR